MDFEFGLDGRWIVIGIVNWFGEFWYGIVLLDVCLWNIDFDEVFLFLLDELSVDEGLSGLFMM